MVRDYIPSETTDDMYKEDYLIDNVDIDKNEDGSININNLPFTSKKNEIVWPRINSNS